MYYIVTVGYDTDIVDKEGNAKVKKIKYLVSADSVEEISLIMARYRSEDIRDSEVLSVVKAPQIETVICEDLTPKYYRETQNQD